MVTREQLLEVLPTYQDGWVVVTKDQDVQDIIESMLQSHQEFAPYYDKIEMYFDASGTKEIADNLYNFCKANIEYREESDKQQTTALPTGILTRGYGDCKHYAGFCGGVLDAINRATGKDIKWKYCFASYDILQKTPYHVFIVIEDKAGPIWLDPTPGSEGKQPAWVIYKKVKTQTIGSMALLKNIAGVELNNGQGYEIGALPGSLNVPPTALPVPEGMPAHLPRPYIFNGRLLLTPVPPNFEPTPEEVAYILMCLQLWINAYGENKVDVFTYSTSTEQGYGYNWFVAMIQNFCAAYKNPVVYNGAAYGYTIEKTIAPSKNTGPFPTTVKEFVQVDINTTLLDLKTFINSTSNGGTLAALMLRGVEVDQIDFFSWPVPGATDWVERNAPLITNIVGKVFAFALAKVFPALGAVFTMAFNKVQAELNSPTDLQEFTQNVQVSTQAIVQQAAAEVEADTARKRKMILIGGAALILMILLFNDNKNQDS